MSSIPKDLRYTKDHEWVRESDDPQVVEVGITDYAQASWGCRVRGAAQGRNGIQAARRLRHDRGGQGGLRAVLAGSGTIVETNKALEQDPALVNRDPTARAGWSR